MAGTERKRIIELTEASTVQSGDYFPIDSASRGTKKVPTDALATSAALTAETNARAGADEQMSERMDGIEEQTALIQNPTKTVSGSLVSFTDGADMPMVACTASIVPKQSGSGTPSPDNVRPISGWESVSVFDTGVNVWDEEVAEGYWNVDNNGVFVTSGNWKACMNKIRCVPNTTYYMNLSSVPTASKGAILFYDSNENLISYITGLIGTFTTPSNAVYMTFYASPAYFNYDISINYPSTDTEYHAYNPNSSTTPVNLGRTVYGGTLDVVSGVLTVDRAIIDLASNQDGWYMASTLVSGKQRLGITVSDIKPATTNIVSNVLPFVGGNATYSGTTGIGTDANYRIVLYKEDLQTVDAWKAWALTNDLKVVYELKDPQTYQLTPTEIQTLLGENNVWADSGDVEITYRRDISIVLENLENALSGSNSLNTMMMSAPTENTAEEPTGDEAEDDMR